MTRKDSHATKADIAGLKDGIAKLEAKSSTKDDLSQLANRTDAGFAAVKGDIARFDAKVDRVATELVRTQSDLREVKETMATKGHMERLMHSFDDHERRISALESSPRPPQAP